MLDMQLKAFLQAKRLVVAKYCGNVSCLSCQSEPFAVFYMSLQRCLNHDQNLVFSSLWGLTYLMPIWRPQGSVFLAPVKNRKRVVWTTCGPSLVLLEESEPNGPLGP